MAPKLNTIRISVILILVSILFSCKPPEKFSWDAGLSGAKYYPSGAPSVSYYYQGMSVSGASTGTGAGQGWGTTSGGYVGGDRLKPVPDSVFIRWDCGFDLKEYEVGARLPRDKMVLLFQNGASDPFGKDVNYGTIVAGMAPGGNATIWLKAGVELTEVVKLKGKYIKEIDAYNPNEISLWTSTGEEAKDILRYIKLHGIPYAVWEKGEDVYDWDIGFTSEEDKGYRFSLKFISKDGSVSSDDLKGRKTQKTEWETISDTANGSLAKLAKLPVHVFVQWISSDNNSWYESEVILPQDFVTRFTKGYRHPKTRKPSHYNRIMIGMEAEIPGDVAYGYGRIWLDGPGKQELVMRFRAAKLNLDSREFTVSKYSLPKDFVFPVWEGREPIVFPALDYWQEPSEKENRSYPKHIKNY